MSHNLVDTEIAESLIKFKLHKCKMISSGLQQWLLSALKNTKLTPGFKFQKSLIVPERGKSPVMNFFTVFLISDSSIISWQFLPTSMPHKLHWLSNKHDKIRVYICKCLQLHGTWREIILSEMQNPVESVLCFSLAVMYVLNARGYMYLISWASCVKWDNCLAG